MCNKLVHKLKLKFGKKTKIPTHIIRDVQHVTDEALNDCWGTVALVSYRIRKKKKKAEDNKCKK